MTTLAVQSYLYADGAIYGGGTVEVGTSAQMAAAAIFNGRVEASQLMLNASTGNNLY